jgi:hypothetical protein
MDEQSCSVHVGPNPPVTQASYHIPTEAPPWVSYKFMNSPVGVLKLVASEKGLVAVLWENDNPRRVRLGDG